MTNKEKHMKLLEMAIDRGFNYCHHKSLNASTINDQTSNYCEVSVFYADRPDKSLWGFDAAVKKIEEYKS